MRADVKAITTDTADLLAFVANHHPQGERVFQAFTAGELELVVTYSFAAAVIVVAAVRPGTLDDAQELAAISARNGACRFRRFGGLVH